MACTFEDQVKSISIYNISDITQTSGRLWPFKYNKYYYPTSGRTRIINPYKIYNYYYFATRC